MKSFLATSTAAMLLVAMATAQAMPVAPPAHSRSATTIQTVDFTSCYMEGLIGAQRVLVNRFGRFGGLALTTLLDAVAGAGAAGVVSLNCLAN